MKDRKNKGPWICLALTGVAALIITMMPSEALTQTCPLTVVCGQNDTNTCDADKDGFTDQEECQGILGANDPNTKDLFVIWVPAQGSPFQDPDPLEFVVKGLPIHIHPITGGDVDQNRIIRGSDLSQKAVRITESLDSDTTQPALGFSWEGTPNGRDEATVYTIRIREHIRTLCGCPGDISSCSGCCDNTRVCGQALFYKYVKHTIAHEIGHMIRPLANVTPRDKENFGGYHYKSGTNVILDQSVKFSQGKFSLGTTYTQSDKDSITLK